MNEASSDEVVRVDFEFKRELARKIEGNLANYCYQCGACVGDCPATAYSPRFNPREIMLKVLYGLGEELIGPDSLLWECTNCYTCHERCPQEVKPVEVIISLKNMMADRGVLPKGMDRLLETFHATGRTVQVSGRVAKERAKFGLDPLPVVPVEEVHAVLEEARPVADDPEDEVVPVTDTRRFAFFPGCLIPTRYPAMEAAIRLTLEKLGLDLLDLEGASCCPDPIYFKSKDKLDWLAVGARNLALAESLEVDVVTNCSGCTATLSEARHLLEDPLLRAQVNGRLARIGMRYRGTSRVRHVATLLRDVLDPAAVEATVVRPLTGLKVAIHYGCHLLKPSAVMAVDDPNDPKILETLVAALGAEPVRHRSWHLCCGKACSNPDIPDTMMRDLLASVRDEEAEILCLICPTCYGQFDHGQARVSRRFEEDFATPSAYYFQLLAFAQGSPYDALGFGRQRFEPTALRHFE